jgi:hypothetical protein
MFGDFAHFDNASVCIANNATVACSDRRVLKPQPGWSATASTSFPGQPASLAIDGSTLDASPGPFNIWATNTTTVNGQFITFDYAVPLDLTGFVYYPRTLGSQDIKDYTVQYSNDGTNFFTIQSGTMEQQPEGTLVTGYEGFIGTPIQVNFLSSVNARFMRLVITSTYLAGSYAAIAELLPVVCSPASLGEISCANAGLLNSGTNSTGTAPVSSLNTFDANWEVALVANTATPSLANVADATYKPAVVIGNKAPTAWINSPYGTSEWIGYTSTGSDAYIGSGATSRNDYFYRYRFTISDPYLLPVFKLKNDYYIDNSVREVYINGAAQGISGGSFLAGTQLSSVLQNNWQLGNNEVIIQTYSQPGYAGFLVQNTTTCELYDFGDAPSSYNVVRATFAAGHAVERNATGGVTLKLGPLVDAEADGVASEGTSDDAAGNDEDGVLSFPSISGIINSAIAPYSVNLAVTNITGAAANLCGWIDWNNNGVFDASESTCTTIANGATSVTLTWTSQVLTGPVGTAGTYARFRITSDALAAGNSNGPASNGEVEDYYIPFLVSLPVTLNSFTAIQNGESAALLKWVSSSEQQSSKFVVERSQDGINWQEIGTVNAGGSTNEDKTYQFEDKRSGPGKNYYRLRIIDIDEKYTYSDVRLVNFGKGSNVLLFPNPVGSEIRLSGLDAGQLIRIINSDGRVIYNSRVTGMMSNIPVNGYAQGWYLLQVIKDGVVVDNLRFVKK